jgi:hypothetical protein
VESAIHTVKAGRPKSKIRLKADLLEGNGRGVRYQRRRKLEQFLFLLFLSDLSIEILRFLFPHAPEWNLQDLHLEDFAREVDGDNLTLLDLLSGLGFMPIQKDQAGFACFLGLGAPFDQSRIGKEAIQAHGVEVLRERLGTTDRVQIRF